MSYSRLSDSSWERPSPNGLWGWGLAGLISVVFIFATFSTEFVIGSAPYWQTQTDDVTQYVSGFNAYFTAPWQWPLLAFSGFNYPSGTLVTFVDGIPLYALFLKIIIPQNFAPFNPFGVWVALCFLLQGFAAWWLTRELQIKSWAFLVTLLAMLLTFPALMARMGHISLMSHWIVLFALALYIQGRRTQSMPVFAWTILLVSGFYVNIYLFVMASGIYAAAWLSSVDQFKPKNILRTLWPCGVLFLSLWVTMLPLPLSEVTPEWGFGYYSMNLLSPILGGSLIDVYRYEGPGQYEGFNYLGLGVLLTVAVVLLNQARSLFYDLMRHKALLFLLLLFTAYAVSNHVYLGQQELAILHYPSFMDKVTSQFRASGRFFWPVGYAIVIFALAEFYAKQHRKYVGLLLIGVLALQALDLKGAYQILVARQGRTKPMVMNNQLWDAQLHSSIKHIYLYPKFKCGKTPLNAYFYPEFKCGREPLSSLLPLMKYVGERNMTLNTGYIARYTPNCDDTAIEISLSSFSDTAYVFDAVEFPEPESFMKFFPVGPKPDCKLINLAYVCQYEALQEKP